MPAECQEKWRRIEDPVNISAIIQEEQNQGVALGLYPRGYFWCPHALKMG